MSKLLSPGPGKKRRREFPNCPNCSLLNNDVLKYEFPCRGFVSARTLPPAKFGTSTGTAPAPTRALSSFSVNVIGRPVAKLTMPLRLQPPSTLRRQPELASLSKGRSQL